MRFQTKNENLNLVEHFTEHLLGTGSADNIHQKTINFLKQLGHKQTTCRFLLMLAFDRGYSFSTSLDYLHERLIPYLCTLRKNKSEKANAFTFGKVPANNKQVQISESGLTRSIWASKHISELAFPAALDFREQYQLAMTNNSKVVMTATTLPELGVNRFMGRKKPGEKSAQNAFDRLPLQLKRHLEENTIALTSKQGDGAWRMSRQCRVTDIHSSRKTSQDTCQSR